MKEFEIEIEINATPKKVWDVFLDLDNYGKWNPVIPSGKGKLEVNHTLELIWERATKTVVFRPIALTARPLTTQPGHHVRVPSLRRQSYCVSAPSSGGRPRASKCESTVRGHTGLGMGSAPTLFRVAVRLRIAPPFPGLVLFVE